MLMLGDKAFEREVQVWSLIRVQVQGGVARGCAPNIKVALAEGVSFEELGAACLDDLWAQLVHRRCAVCAPCGAVGSDFQAKSCWSPV